MTQGKTKRLNSDPPQSIYGSGECVELVRTTDWSATTLGPLDGWPAEFTAVVNTILNSPTAIVLMCGDGGVLIYNDAYAFFASEKHPEIFGQTAAEAWPEIADYNRGIIKRIKAGGTISYKNQLLKLQRKDVIEDVYLDLDYSPFFDKAGRIVGVQVLVVDTTEQVTSRRAIEDSQKRYQTLFSSIDQGFCVIEMMYDQSGVPCDYTFVEVNAVFEAQTGLQNPVGKTAKQLVPNLERHWLEAYGAVASTGTPSRFTNGSDAMGRWFDVYATRVDEADSHKVALLFTDISERRLAEKEKDRALRQVINILESISDAFFSVDKDWTIVLVNKRFEEVANMSRQEVIGKNFWETFPEAKDSAKSFWKNYQEVMTKREMRHFIDYYKPIELWSDVRAYPTSDGGMSVFSTDISERLIAEKSLEEAMIRSRQLEQTTKNLADQRRQLVALNKVKDEFIGTASHQLRTPATAVKQYVSLLKDGFSGRLTEEQQMYADKAFASNERQLAIINDLLKTAQIDAKRFAIKQSYVKVADLIAKVRSDLAHTLSARDQRLIVQDRAADLILDIDAVEMNLVLVNIVENASKYSPKGSTITIRAYREKRHVIIEVKDEGVGIAKENSKRIFQKFTRIDNKFSDTVDGSGLGLYMANRIVKLHKGSIKVQAVPSGGTTFIVSLPYDT